MALHGAMLFVKDLKRMTAFYSEVLGLTVVHETRLSNWVEFQSNGSRFSLHAISPEIAAGISIETPPAPRERSATKLTFQVADVNDTLLRSRRWVCRSCAVRGVRSRQLIRKEMCLRS